MRMMMLMEGNILGIVNCNDMEDMNSFAKDLWGVVDQLIEENEEACLLYLYDTLNSKIDSGGIEDCDDFLKEGLLRECVSPDVLVHVASVLSRVQDELSNWKDFVVFSRENLRETLDSWNKWNHHTLEDNEDNIKE